MGKANLHAAAPLRLQIYWIIAILFICVGTVTAVPTRLPPWRPSPVDAPTHRMYYPPPPRRPSPPAPRPRRRSLP